MAALHNQHITHPNTGIGFTRYNGRTGLLLLHSQGDNARIKRLSILLKCCDLFRLRQLTPDSPRLYTFKKELDVWPLAIPDQPKSKVGTVLQLRTLLSTKNTTEESQIMRLSSSSLFKLYLLASSEAHRGEPTVTSIKYFVSMFLLQVRHRLFEIHGTDTYLHIFILLFLLRTLIYALSSQKACLFSQEHNDNGSTTSLFLGQDYLTSFGNQITLFFWQIEVHKSDPWKNGEE